MTRVGVALVSSACYLQITVNERVEFAGVKMRIKCSSGQSIDMLDRGLVYQVKSRTCEPIRPVAPATMTDTLSPKMLT